MKEIEAANEELKDVLPKSYNRLENDTLVALLKTLSGIPPIDGDAFSRGSFIPVWVTLIR